MPPKPVKLKALESDGWKLSEASKTQVIMKGLEAGIANAFQVLSNSLVALSEAARAVEAAARSVEDNSEANIRSIEKASSAIDRAVIALAQAQTPRIDVKPNIVLPDDKGAVWEFEFNRDNIRGFIKTITARKR